MAEAWRISERHKIKGEGVEMTAVGRSMCISRREWMRNDVITQ